MVPLSVANLISKPWSATVTSPVTWVATFHWIGLPLATDVAGAQGREPRIAAPVDGRHQAAAARHTSTVTRRCRCSRIVRTADWAVQRAGRPERSNLISV